MKKTIRTIVRALLCLKYLSWLPGSVMVFTLLTVLCVNRGQCQEISTPAGLTIGQQVPDIKIDKVFNYKDESLRLSDFKNKLLVLVFWNTTCRFTRESMERMNKIQLELKDRIQIVAVADESPQLLKAAFAKDPVLASTAIPIVTGGTSLKAMFPNLILPHLAWIYNGRVKAITDIQYLNKENINSALNDRPLAWPVKSDIKDFDYKKPFLNSAYGQPASRPVYYSQLSAYLPGVAPGYGVEVDSLNRTIRTWVVNFPAYKMYLMAFSRFLGLPATQTLWEVKNKGKYVYTEKEGYRGSWNMENSYCYESVLPLGIASKDRLERLRTDLNNFLNLNGRKETRTVDALVLEFNRDKLPASTAGKYTYTLHRSDTVKVLRKAALSSISWEMNKYPENPPVLFDKSVNPLVDLDLPVKSMTDVEVIRRSLQPYGISLRSEKREVEFFVFTEKDLQPKSR